MSETQEEDPVETEDSNDLDESQAETSLDDGLADVCEETEELAEEQESSSMDEGVRAASAETESLDGLEAYTGDVEEESEDGIEDEDIAPVMGM